MQPVFILSFAASGTPALVKVLNANGVTCLGAAFDITNRYEYGLAHFLESRNVGAAELIATPDAVLDEYLTYCAELVRSERFCLDVDTDFVHLFSGRAFALGKRPHLADFIRERQFRIVHFSHRGGFEQAVRLQLRHDPRASPEAAAAGRAGEPLILNIAHCERQLRLSAGIAKRMEAWFAGYANRVELIYEDVFEQDCVSEAGASLLESLFGCEIADRSLQGSAAGAIGLVSNAREVIKAFAGTPYAEEVQRLLGSPNAVITAPCLHAMAWPHEHHSFAGGDLWRRGGRRLCLSTAAAISPRRAVGRA